MAGQSYIPSYGSLVVDGQIIGVPTASQFQPGPAVGPILAGYGQAPLATLPSGNYGIAAGGPAGMNSVQANQNSIAPRYLAWGLAAMFVLAVLGLEFVHWRA